ncbi:MAG: histidine kinase [Chitinophagaceae bacterium]|nr:MAG: histidine kinase [Chitinophagaceae bacterium]
MAQQGHVAASEKHEDAVLGARCGVDDILEDAEVAVVPPDGKQVGALGAAGAEARSKVVPVPAPQQCGLRQHQEVLEHRERGFDGVDGGIQLLVARVPIAVAQRVDGRAEVPERIDQRDARRVLHHHVGSIHGVDFRKTRGLCHAVAHLVYFVARGAVAAREVFIVKRVVEILPAAFDVHTCGLEAGDDVGELLQLALAPRREHVDELRRIDLVAVLVGIGKMKGAEQQHLGGLPRAGHQDLVGMGRADLFPVHLLGDGAGAGEQGEHQEQGFHTVIFCKPAPPRAVYKKRSANGGAPPANRRGSVHASFADKMSAFADKAPRHAPGVVIWLMTRRQLTYTYALILVVLVWGIDGINALKFGERVELRSVFSVFNLSQLVYAAGTLVATRLILRRLRPRPVLAAAALAALIPAFVLLRYGMEELLFPAAFGYRNYNPNTPFGFYFLDNIYYALVYMVLGSIVYFADESMRGRRQARELEQRGREAELAFLRAQVNPHFLFNALNNIYALSYKSSPKAPEAILKLSELMRYMLYERKELLPAATEWEYVEHFIGLQQLRYERPLRIDLRLEGDAEICLLPPYLLLAFVENAFKHGDAAEPMRFHLKAAAGRLRFSAANSIGRQQKDSGSGIGLANVRRRLELLYPGRHELLTRAQGGLFEVSLELEGTPAGSRAIRQPQTTPDYARSHS